MTSLKFIKNAVVKNRNSICFYKYSQGKPTTDQSKTFRKIY